VKEDERVKKRRIPPLLGELGDFGEFSGELEEFVSEEFVNDELAIESSLRRKGNENLFFLCTDSEDESNERGLLSEDFESVDLGDIIDSISTGFSSKKVILIGSKAS